MSDTITKWHEMEDERKLAELENQLHQYNKEINESQQPQYVFVFDYYEGNKVFRYDISNLDGSSEVVEAYLSGAGHRLKNCDWMVSKYKFVENGN